MTSSKLRLCYREIDRDRHHSLPWSAEQGGPRGVINRSVPLKPCKDSSRSQINWNPWILTCMLVITIVMLALVEAHIKRAAIHPSFLR